MSRIVYVSPVPQSNTGGNKMTFRHVEALNELGFRAVVRAPPGSGRPSWFRHDAPIEDASHPLHPDDVLVLPEDSRELLERCAGLPNRKVIFCQSPAAITGYGFAAAAPDVRRTYRHFMACSAGVAGLISRFFDYEVISVVPAFVDERIFRPLPKARVIACSPRKRPLELLSIRYMFERLHDRVGDWSWEILETATEAETAAAMGRAAVFLSLARMEAAALTTLEAMACDCLVAGFTGVGPREYTNPTNGLWVEEDDLEAAAHALVRATAMAEAGGGAAALMRHAGRATVANWSRGACVDALHGFWRDQMGVAP